MKCSAQEYLVSRTQVRICIGLISKICTLVQGAITFGVNRAYGKNMGQHFSSLAICSLFSVRVTSIGYNMEGIESESRPNCLSHWLQATVVGSVEYYLMSDYQRMLWINSALHTVDGESAVAH